ncbi:MAG: hypothetical protein U5L73_05515 [Rhodoferax sp.]|uniref:hypothetical protein n=1 Tax=Rhodoferax sp. TaxID=50421 RepID=UPI002ACE0B6E|nr:hypothetical protein [Rhodoferax sp.]MDZ7891199.1 hypothetical protein [Rhodoferax sp.]
MGDVLRGLGSAQLQATLLAAVVVGVHMAGVGAARIQLPQQLQRQHPGLAGAQPHQQLRQQAARAEQQGGRRIHARRQLQRGIKYIGQRKPGVDLGALAIGAVQRVHHLGTKAPHHAPARQGPQLAPGAHAQAGQRGQVHVGRRQGVHRQGIGQHRTHRRGLPHPTGVHLQRGKRYQRSSALRIFCEGYRLIWL